MSESSNSTISTNDSIRQRNVVDKPSQIGYTLDELKAKRKEPKWKVARYTAVVLFWTIWGALLAGSIVIIVLNDGQFSSTTATPTTTTTKGT